MSDVSSWLVENGFGRYVETFEASDITIDLLPELNQDDLKELGLSLGHQKKFLRIVQSLSVDTSTVENLLPSARSRSALIDHSVNLYGSHSPSYIAGYPPRNDVN